MVKLFGSHRRIRRIDNHPTLARRLNQSCGFVAIALRFDMMEVFGVQSRLVEAIGIAMQHDVLFAYAKRDVIHAIMQRYGLPQGPVLGSSVDGASKCCRREQGVAFAEVYA